MVGLMKYYQVGLPDTQTQFMDVVDDEHNNDLAWSWRWTPFHIKERAKLPKYRLVCEVEGKVLPESDSLGIDGTLIFSRKAVNLLGSILERNGKLFEIEVINSENAFIFEPQLLNGINFDGSDCFRAKSGRIMSIRSAELISENLFGVDIFRESVAPQPLLGSQNFVDAWDSSHLSGIEFYERGQVQLDDLNGMEF